MNTIFTSNISKIYISFNSSQKLSKFEMSDSFPLFRFNPIQFQHHQVNRNTGIFEAPEVVEKSFKLSSELDEMNFIHDFENVRKCTDNPTLIPFLERVSECALSRRFIAGSSLLDFLQNSGKDLNFSCLIPICEKIAMAVQYLHENQIPLYSLKHENIIISQTEDEQFANTKLEGNDFSILVLNNLPELQNDTTNNNNNITPYLVDYGIRATTKDLKPNSIIYYGPNPTLDSPYETDIWSLGIIFYSTLIGNLPWETKNLPRLMRSMNSHEIPFPDFFPPELKELITNMLSPTASDRPKIDHILTILQNVETRKDINFFYPQNTINANNKGLIPQKRAIRASKSLSRKSSGHCSSVALFALPILNNPSAEKRIKTEKRKSVGVTNLSARRSIMYSSSGTFM
ncbi:hypothetical protein TRFO_09121 [Tritrichomonas foetus]|uniref:Protein kinase domain-containing protein n=1 Tax=Tritrichomonas foetus TaxID=1144522 RepID=A0A1J4JI63_9EUKA|nr:hypothetical protein TRFO_09121 [Tritrichomonas foetus]|eukprot:OHS97975.1 hypothetical protein TRFO_09121 [Tritrichomonas foetus]